MLKFRAISFPLLLALCFLMLFWKAGGPYIFLVVATGAMMLLADEFLRILEKLGIPGMRWPAVATAGIFALSAGGPNSIRIGLAAVLLMPILTPVRLLFGGDRAAFLRRLFPTIGAVYLILLIYSPMIALFNDLTPFLFLFFIHPFISNIHANAKSSDEKRLPRLPPLKILQAAQ